MGLDLKRNYRESQPELAVSSQKTRDLGLAHLHWFKAKEKVY